MKNDAPSGNAERGWNATGTLSANRTFKGEFNTIAESAFVFGCFIPAVGLLVRLLFRHALQHLRIGYRSGNHVAAAGPFPQVDQAAALAAEGKILRAGQH